jgi:OmpA-OmpF porin, OOP family
MYKKTAIAALLAASGLVSTAAFAQGYVGVSGGLSRWDVDCSGASSCDKSDTAFKIFGGYNLNPTFAIEGAYVDLGKATASGGGISADAKGTGFEIAGVIKAPFTREFTGFAKLGVARMEGKVSGSGFGFSASDTETSTQFVGGLGLSYALSKEMALRGEWENRRFDLPGNDKATVNTFTVGLQLNF